MLEMIKADVNEIIRRADPTILESEEVLAVLSNGSSVPDFQTTVRLWSHHAAHVARRDRWAVPVVISGWLHLTCFGICQAMALAGFVGPEFLLVWATEAAAILLCFRLTLGKGWTQTTPLASLIWRVYLTLLILMFNAVTLNSIVGLIPDDNWFKLAWVGLGTFALMVFCYMATFRFFAAAVVMFLTGTLLAWMPVWDYLIFGISWWIVAHAVAWSLQKDQGDWLPSSPKVRDLGERSNGRHEIHQVVR